jgi:hypothetical protein
LQKIYFGLVHTEYTHSTGQTIQAEVSSSFTNVPYMHNSLQHRVGVAVDQRWAVTHVRVTPTEFSCWEKHLFQSSAGQSVYLSTMHGQSDRSDLHQPRLFEDGLEDGEPDVAPRSTPNCCDYSTYMLHC